jgi:hypothetical protein
MKCLYCHENVQSEANACPQCGLPLDSTARATTVSPGARRNRRALPAATLAAVAVSAIGGFVLGGGSARTGSVQMAVATSQPLAASTQAARPAADPASASAPSRFPIESAALIATEQPELVSERNAWKPEPDPREEHIPRSAKQRPVALAVAPRWVVVPQLPPPHLLALDPFQVPQPRTVVARPVASAIADVSVETASVPPVSAEPTGE